MDSVKTMGFIDLDKLLNTKVIKPKIPVMDTIEKPLIVKQMLNEPIEAKVVAWHILYCPICYKIPPRQAKIE